MMPRVCGSRRLRRRYKPGGGVVSQLRSSWIIYPVDARFTGLEDGSDKSDKSDGAEMAGVVI